MSMRRKHVKRLSRSLITTLLVVLLAFAFIGCRTTPEVEAIEPAVPVVEPVTPPVAEAEEEYVAPVEEPVEEPPMEEVAVAPPVRKAPTADMVVKSNDRFTEFDLYIAHTNDVLGALDSGIGYARLATGVNFGRSLTNKTLLLDAGNVASGSPMVEYFYGEPAGAMLGLLGYDAVAPGPADFAYGTDYLVEAARFAEANTDLKVLSANVLNARGEWVFQPYQLYSYNGFVVAVAGVSAPVEGARGLSFLSQDIVDNAQYAVDQAREMADFVVLLGNIGNVNGITSEVIAQEIKGIDLIIDGKGAMAPAGGKRVGDTVIVNAGEKLSSVGVVEVHVRNNEATRVSAMRINATDVNQPSRSALAQWAGISYVPEDAEVRAYIDSMNAAYAKATAPKPVVEAPKPEPVVEEVAVVPPVREVPADAIVKSDDRFTEFDLYIAHTNDVLGALDSGIGYARLATGVNFGRSLTNKTLLLDAGNVASGSAAVEYFYGEPAGAMLDLLGYDAVAPGPADFAYGTDYLVEAARFAEANTDLKVLSANVLNARGEWVFQPYQLYSYNGFVVAVAGVSAPVEGARGLSFLSQDIVDNAQYAVDQAREMADFVVLLG